jgi:hypothetical protein
MATNNELARIEPAPEGNVFDMARIFGVPMADVYYSLDSPDTRASLMTPDPNLDLRLPAGMLLTDAPSQFDPRNTEAPGDRQDEVPKMIGFVRINGTVHLFGPTDLQPDGRLINVPRIVRRRLARLNGNSEQDYETRPTLELTGGSPVKVISGEDAAAIYDAQQEARLLERTAREIPAALAALMLLGESDNSEFAQELAIQQELVLRGLFGRLRRNQ